MPASYFRPGDEVAILPHDQALPSEVLEIATIEKSGPDLVQLVDGRKFATLGGRTVLARAEHRTALLKSREVLRTVGC